VGVYSRTGRNESLVRPSPVPYPPLSTPVSSSVLPSSSSSAATGVFKPIVKGPPVSSTQVFSVSRLDTHGDSLLSASHESLLMRENRNRAEIAGVIEKGTYYTF
jgi:hypothetical protein